MAHETSFDFHKKTALVTGGTSGIGRAAALSLARAGANVVFTGRRAPEGERVLAELNAIGKESGAKAAFVRGDVTDEKHVQDAVAHAARLGGGRLDFAVNNAGVELMGVETKDATADHYRRVFDVNVLGVLLSMKHEIAAMLGNAPGPGSAAGARGSIVNTSSVAGTIGMAGVGIYVASKHAVLGLTKSAALEVAKQGIRINAVSPAAIDTEMFDRFTGNKQPDTMAYMASLHPIGRIGTVDEIARPVLFLLSDAASFVTGADFKIDGGLTVP